MSSRAVPAPLSTAMRDDLSGGGRIAPLLAGAVLGPAFQLQQGELWSVAACAAIFALSLVAGIFFCSQRVGGRLYTRRLCLLLAVSALSFSLTALRAHAFLACAFDISLESRDLQLTGVVFAMPQRSETGTRFRLEVEWAQLQNRDVRVPPLVLLGWYVNDGAPPADLRAGERWRMTVRLKAPHGQVNPHGFDYELWLWEQGLQATGYVRAGPRDVQPVRIGDTGWHPVERARQSVRDAIYAQVEERKLAGLVAALVTGDQNAIDKADWDIFRATGVAHLMSISGLHITMFAWLAALLVGALWRRSARLCLAWPAPHAALAGGVLLATLYALFSGWGVPAQRTVWMLATVGALRMAGATWPWPHRWLLACAVVVTLDPWALMQAGFWLSFVAVGVLFATDRGLPAVRWATRRERMLQAALAALREQWIITVALTPLTLLLFGQVSVVGLAANAFAIPWVTLVVTPLAMAGVLVPALWSLAAAALQGLAGILAWLAALPFATVSAPAPALWAGMAGVAGGVVLAMRLPWHCRVLGIALLLPVLLWQVPRPAAGQFDVLAADVGQGNALLVRTAEHTLVYDAGPRYGPESDAGHRVLVPLLRALDEQVDTLVLSHRDLDHTGGAAAVLAMQPQAKLLSSIEDGHELQSIRHATRCIAGQHWRWEGVDFEILHPQAADYDGPNKSNAMSCVLRISNGTASALLAGDIEQPQEARIVRSGLLQPVDLLLVPHHGSKTSSSAEFLEAVRPKLAIVQAGYRNRFGHPAGPVMARYAEREVQVVASPACGAALWQSAQPLALRCERRHARRYWRAAQ
jgi:competence protein ComEC